MKLLNLTGIILSGICLGILTGLSISPVVQSIITALITIITAVLTFTTGLSNNVLGNDIQKRVNQINLIPTASFILFFTIGTFCGLYMRTNNVLGKSVNDKIQTYKDLGFTSREIKDLLLDRELKNDVNTASQPDKTMLFSSLTDDELGHIRLKSGKALEIELRALNKPAINSFLNTTSDSLAIEALKIFLCTRDSL